MMTTTADGRPTAPGAVRVGYSADGVGGEPITLPVVHDLRAALSDDVVVTDVDRLQSYRRDMSSGTAAGTPLALVLPRNATEVATALQIARRHGTGVVPRGAGSGLAGGANAVDGTITLGLERMAAIVEIDPVDSVAVVEPGVVNHVLRQAVAEFGLYYAPDPASRDWCTIGGNIATNAGGLCCVKYGVTRDWLLGLDVVLADGTSFHTGRRTIKGVAGYDLAQLLCGSEGTLAVTTRATVRLKPLPAPPVTLLATFATVQEAGAACSAALRVLTPSLMELMDRATLAAVSRGRNLGVDADVEVMLVAQVDSPGDAGLAEAQLMEQICVAHGAIDVMTSSDPAESEMLLAARRFAYAAIEELGRTMSDDVAVPRSKIADFLLGVERVAAEHQVHICSFGHAGDGNMHPTIVVPHGDEAAAVAMFDAFEAILRLARSLGGTVTGEHGVGLLKVAYLGEEIGPISAALQLGIKSVFDPSGILNPGKSFPA